MKLNPQLEELKYSLLSQIEESVGYETLSKAVPNPEVIHFPGSKTEEWKYSPFSVPANQKYFVRQGIGSTSGICKSFFLDGCLVLDFLDGNFVPNSESNGSLSGFELGPIQNLGSEIVGYENNIFSQLNNATARLGGIKIKIAPNAFIEKPIIFAFHFSESDQASWIQPRIQIEVGEGATVSFAEFWEIPTTNSWVVNSTSEIRVGASADVNWINFEMGSRLSSLINQTRVEIEEKSVFQHVVVSLGEGYVRNNLEIKINGAEGDVHMYGLSLGNQKFHVDHHTFVNHKAVNTTSNQLYKGIFSGKSTGVFNGKILVDQVAQKTNAYQSSKNILFSNDAKVYAKPQLEIFADDVKCSHGATIGQLDEEPIFYLRSRGLDEVMAKKLLVQAFASEIQLKIDNEMLRLKIGNAVEEYLSAMLA